MKARERLLKEIQSDLIFTAALSLLIPIAFIWIREMPRISGYLWGGVLFLLAKIILTWIRYQKTDPAADDISAASVVVCDIDQNGLLLNNERKIPWLDLSEIRKVYRSLPHNFLLFGGCKNPSTRQFFYVIRLNSGEWLRLSNIGLISLRGSFRGRLTKDPLADDLLERFLAEAQKHARISLTSHDEVNTCFEVLDLGKEIESLRNYAKK